MTQTQSKPKANEKLTSGKAAPVFQMLETYEAMLREQIERPEGFDLRHGEAERLALLYYEKAKAQAVNNRA